MLPQAMPPRARRAPGTTEPRGLVPALVLLGFGLTALCGVMALLVWGQLPNPAPTPDLPAVATSAAPSPSPLPSQIEGTVWDDACDEHEPSTPACLLDPSGRYRANGLPDPGEPGLPNLRVTLGVGACPAVPTLTLLTGAAGDYHFGGLPAGTYCVTIDPAEAENIELIPGGWSFPMPGAGVAAQVTVNTGSGQTATVNFGWDRHEEPPTPTPTPTLPVAVPTATVIPGCSDYAAFMADVTIPDQTILPGGAPFVKTWRVLNTGSCAWDGEYGLFFATGESMGSPVSLPLTETVEPGSTLELSLNLVAPVSPGPHTGGWMFRGRDGEPFGTGPGANVPLAVRIVVSGTYATAPPPPPPPPPPPRAGPL